MPPCVCRRPCGALEDPDQYGGVGHPAWVAMSAAVRTIVIRSRGGVRSIDRRRLGGRDRHYDAAVAARLIWGNQRISRASLLVVADGLAAAVICTAVLVSLASLHTSTPAVLMVATVVMASATVAWRRVAPYPAAWVGLLAVVAYQRLTRQAVTGLVPAAALLLDIYTAAVADLSRRQIIRLFGLVTVSLGAVVLVASNSPDFSVATVVQAALPVVVAPATAGVMVAWYRSLTRRLALTRALLEDEQELRVAGAAVEERHRLAREVHDVVAHAVSVMVIQAGLARLSMDDDPSTAQLALRRIVSAGKEALDDLRRLIGPAGRDDEPSSGRPANLSRLSELMQAMSSVGLATELVVVGEPEQLSEDVGQLVYRVVQEALTNALKHSGRGSALITLHVHNDSTDVRIANSASGRPVELSRLVGGGHGLVGMAERVNDHGGTLQSGELRDGGFEVHAHVPLADLEPRRGRKSRLRVLWSASNPWRSITFAAATLVALELDAALSAWRRGSLAENVILVGAMAVATLWRRARPLAACIAINALAIPLSGGLADITQATVVSTFVFVVPVYSAAAWAALRPAAVALAVTVMAMVSFGVWHHATASEIIADLLLTLGLWAVGRMIRHHRSLAGALERASAALLAERAERQQIAVSDERGRIVSNLQASITRQVTAMVRIAETLLDQSRAEPGNRAESAASIELSGRAALAQTRHILGILRSDPRLDGPNVFETIPG